MDKTEHFGEPEGFHFGVILEYLSESRFELKDGTGTHVSGVHKNSLSDEVLTTAV